MGWSSGRLRAGLQDVVVYFWGCGWGNLTPGMILLFLCSVKDSVCCWSPSQPKFCLLFTVFLLVLENCQNTSHPPPSASQWCWRQDMVWILQPGRGVYLLYLSGQRLALSTPQLRSFGCVEVRLQRWQLGQRLGMTCALLSAFSTSHEGLSPRHGACDWKISVRYCSQRVGRSRFGLSAVAVWAGRGPLGASRLLA